MGGFSRCRRGRTGARRLPGIITARVRSGSRNLALKRSESAACRRLVTPPAPLLCGQWLPPAGRRLDVSHQNVTFLLHYHSGRMPPRCARPAAADSHASCAPRTRNPRLPVTGPVASAQDPSLAYSMLSPCNEMSSPSRSCSSVTRSPIVLSMICKIAKLTTKAYTTVVPTPFN
jgi:hypothetical protein